MEQEKPFKTIEVVDSRTNQVCKVACMSCIRGHRTTSCGIPVCRTKIFWTVKRPGRPSNSCTCRYGATGGCKCVVARSACPHKSKKGEKRSGECRCDEQGRYCCVLEPDHWNTLLALGNPSVNFFSTREALEAKQIAIAQAPLPPTPAYSAMASPPPSMHSVPSTPGPNGHVLPMQIVTSGYEGYPPQQPTTLTPRFGMMGIEAPMGSQRHVSTNVLIWEGQAPTAPGDFNPVFESMPEGQRSCCQPARPSTHDAHSPRPETEASYTQPASMPPASHGLNSTHDHSLSGPLSPQIPHFDLERLRTDYFNYQFPSAICQNCGLNGCTCKNCPPPFQNYGTGSWAQCCGRKHARDVQPNPAPVKVARTETYDSSMQSQAQQQPVSVSHSQEHFVATTPFHLDGHDFANGFVDLALPHVEGHPDFSTFDIDNDLLLADVGQPLDISEFLNSELERMHPESPTARDEGERNGIGTGVGAKEGGGNTGGGCCCRGP